GKDTKYANSYFLRLERELGIKNGVLKNLRRDVLSNSQNKSEVYKKLYRYVKSYTTKAEILDLLGKVTSEQKPLSTPQKIALGVGLATAGAIAGANLVKDEKLKK